MLGKIIKQYLEDNGITQTYICTKTGISAPKMSLILRDERKIIAEEYGAICKALNVDLSFFMDIAYKIKSKSTLNKQNEGYDKEAS